MIDSPKKERKVDDNAWPSNMPSQIDHVHKVEDDEKMMEDEIDRMIA